MSKVFTVCNGKTGEKIKIPTVEYINELTKMVEDILISINKDFPGFAAIKTSSEELPVGIKQVPDVLAKDVKTDSEHKFINEAILNTLVDKPTKYEMESYVSESKEEIKELINEIYMRIVNTPNVINKLRDISTILNEDEIASGLLNTLSYKVNFEDFQEHSKSSIHMSNNDRKALNILLKCLTIGFADWNAEGGAYNAIKNKPESLPANGGNADTVSNHDIKDLINKDDYDIVIGDSREKYSKDSCDIYAKEGNIDQDTLNSSLKNGGVILFKRGSYNVDYIDTYIKPRVFKGVDRRLSCIKANGFININNCVFKHIAFADSVIYIKSDCEIENVSFKNCKIVFIDADDSNITGCQFNNCVVEYNGYIMNSIIKNNRFIRTKPIQYIGGNNIISDNIYTY